MVKMYLLYYIQFVNNVNPANSYYIPEVFITDEELIKFVIEQIEKFNLSDKVKIGIKFAAEKLYSVYFIYLIVS